MKRILLLVGLLLISFPGLLWGQERWGQPYFQVNYRQGVHWSRTEYLQDMLEGGFRGVEARIGFQTTGLKDWHQLNNYPRLGFGMHYADEILGRPDSSLSNPFSVFGFYQAPIARFGRFSLNTSWSVGLSYMRLIYDHESNPYNDIVASHFNLFFDLNLNLALQVDERLDLNLGYGVSHYSNGNLHEPQKGLNNWGWNLGMSYLFGGGGERPFRRRAFQESPLEEFIKWEEVQIMLAFGVAERQPHYLVVGEHYMTASFTTDYAVHFARRSALTCGLDILYDESLEYSIKGVPPPEVDPIMQFYFGGHMGYQFKIDRFTLLINLGTYFKHYSYDREFFFARAGGRYRISKHLAGHLCIKSRNGIRSDWIEWGLAYNIKTR